MCIRPLISALSVPGLCRQVERSEIRQLDAARVCHDQDSPALFYRLPDAHADHRVLLGGVRSDDEDCLCLAGDIFNGIGHCARAECGGQTGHSAGVSKTGAVVDVVRPDHLPGELIHQIILFIGALGRGQHTD